MIVQPTPFAPNPGDPPVGQSLLAWLKGQFSRLAQAVNTIDHVRFMRSVSSDDQYALHEYATADPEANNAGSFIGGGFEVYSDAANSKTIGELEGGFFYAQHDGSGALASLAGAFVGAQNTGHATVTDLVGLEIGVDGGSNTTVATGLRVLDVVNATTKYVADFGLGIFRLAGGQIKFPATAIPSSDPNTLDDYEEGTWTPVIGGSGGTSGQTYSLQSGTYTKKGREVTVRFDVALTAKGTITTNVQIQGFPFAPSGNAPVIITYWSGLNTAVLGIPALLDAAGTVATLRKLTAATTDSAAASLATADLTNTTRVIGTVVYDI